MQDEPESEHEAQESAERAQEAVQGASGQPPVKQQCAERPKGGYFSEFRNWVSFLTLLFVAAYTVITFFLLLSGRSASKQQHSDARNALTNAERNEGKQLADTALALQRAVAANKIARDTARRELRAYLTITGMDVKVIKKNEVTAAVKVENTGRTPAFDFTGWTCLYVGDFRVVNGVMRVLKHFPGPHPNQRRTPHTLIGPGGDQIIQHMSFCGGTGAPTNRLTADDISRLKNRTAAIYLYGHWTYKDAFKHPRYISFHVLSNSLGGITVGEATLNMRQGTQGN